MQLVVLFNALKALCNPAMSLLVHLQMQAEQSHIPLIGIDHFLKILLMEANPATGSRG